MAKTRVGRAVLTLGGLLVAGVGGLTYARYRHDLAQARARVLTGSQIAETRGGLIEYAILGDDPPVLIVHGAGGGFDQGLDFAKGLTERGFRAIAMSRFGYLRTPLPADASAAAQADAHACLLDALHIQRAAVIGVSAGAPSSLQLALRHATRCTAIVLLVPAAYVPRPAGQPATSSPGLVQVLFATVLRSDFLFWLATKVARPTLIRTILATPPEALAGVGTDEQARLLQVLHHLLPISQRQQGLMNDAAVVSSLPRYELERIAVPTLIISVADDLFGTFERARYTAQQIPGARFIGYTSGGHLWVGHQQDVLAEITAFLKERRSGMVNVVSEGQAEPRGRCSRGGAG